MRCEEKRAYKSKIVAKAHRKKALRERGVELSVYKCPTCKMWHLSSQKWEGAA